MVLVFLIDLVRVEINTKLVDFLKMRSCTLSFFGGRIEYTTTNGCITSTSKCKECDASFFTTLPKKEAFLDLPVGGT
jgi:hypothetical protein